MEYQYIDVVSAGTKLKAFDVSISLFRQLYHDL